jgi:hypothetical protein
VEVLPPFVLYGTDRMTDEDYPDVAKVWEQRLLTLESTEPIAFRRQNFGDPITAVEGGPGSAGPQGFRPTRAGLAASEEQDERPPAEERPVTITRAPTAR